MRPVIVVPLLTFLAACATAAPQVDGPAPPGPTTGQIDRDPAAGPTAEADLEAIYGAWMGNAGLTVRVNSNGCTKKADFTTQVLEGWPAATLILRRTKPDLCRAFVAGGTELTFSYADLKIKPTSALVLANPITSDPTPGR